MTASPALAVFAYNRPDHVARCLEALARCERLGECHVVVYCDGPRVPAHAEAVARTRQVVRAWCAGHGAGLVEQPGNLGLAGSISAGVAELCAAHGSVIVVEDDLVVSPDFVGFMIAALERYADCPDVLQVSGHTLCDLPGKGSASFMPLTTTWGWATWARAWRCFDPAPRDIDAALADPEFRARFDIDGGGTFPRMLADRLAGRNDSWGVLWWYAVARRAGLVLYPHRSLVWNGGFDASGVHCGDGGFAQPPVAAFAVPRLPKPLAFPNSVAVNQDAYRTARAFLRGEGAMSLLARGRRWLRRRLLVRI